MTLAHISKSEERNEVYWALNIWVSFPKVNPGDTKGRRTPDAVARDQGEPHTRMPSPENLVTRSSRGCSGGTRNWSSMIKQLTIQLMALPGPLWCDLTAKRIRRCPREGQMFDCTEPE